MSLKSTYIPTAETVLSTRIQLGVGDLVIASLRLGVSDYEHDLEILVADRRVDAAAWLDTLADEATELAARVRDLRPTKAAA